MRKFLAGVAFIFLIPLGVRAQQEFPKAEIFGGYSYFRANPDGFNLNGWNASITGNITPWFGIEGDFSGHYGKPKADGFVIPGISLNSHTIMGGPKITARNGNFAPFAHFLIGLNRAGSNDNGDVASNIALSTVIGGGFDFSVHKNVAIRAFQLDYLMTQFDVNDDGRHERQNNFRFSAGIVFKF
jgi:hypothetical protein